MNPYFICALPRSRTAWLANFLSYGPSHCFHEPYNKYDLIDLPGLFHSTFRQYVGVSDSLNTFMVDKILNIFPGAKLILIRRPVSEVDNSLREIGFPCRPLLEQMEQLLNLIAIEYTPLVIDFHDFDAAGIWNFIMPQIPLNQDRTRMLESFNITVPKPVIVKKAAELIQRCSNQVQQKSGGEVIR